MPAIGSTLGCQLFEVGRTQFQGWLAALARSQFSAEGIKPKGRRPRLIGDPHAVLGAWSEVHTRKTE